MKGYKRILKHYFEHAKEFKYLFALTVLFYGAAYGLISVWKPLIIKQLIDSLNANGDETQTLILLFLGVVFVHEILFSLGDFMIAKFEINFMTKLRNISMSHILKHSPQFFAKTFTGSLVSKSRRFVGSSETVSDEVVFSFLFVFIDVIGILTVVFFFSVQLSLAYLVWIAVYILLIYVFLGKRSKLDSAAANAESTVTGVLSDIVANVLNVKMFGAIKEEKKNFENVTLKYKQVQGRAWNFANWQNVMQRTLIFVLQGGMALWGFILWKKGSITPGTFYLLMAYSMSLSGVLWNLSRSIRRFSRAVMEAEEMVDIIELSPDIVDTESSKKVPVSVLNGTPSIVLKDISFKYPGGTTVFKGLDLVFDAGKSVGIVGTTGAGKTTLTNLLLRLREPNGGSIQIDGHDIVRDLTQESLLKYISYVPQNVDLFHRSVFENIAYGKKNATREEVIHAARQACIHDFIETLSKGYDTVVGERGVMLSGGQRQRIAIARAIVCGKPITLFDEATSSLDTITESEIQNMLATNFKGKTMIVIAHRLSTIRNVDRIIVLEDGAVIEDGTHEELIQLQGKYARLWNQQQRVEDDVILEKTGFTGSGVESSVK